MTIKGGLKAGMERAGNFFCNAVQQFQGDEMETSPDWRDPELTFLIGVGLSDALAATIWWQRPFCHLGNYDEKRKQLDDLLRGVSRNAHQTLARLHHEQYVNTSQEELVSLRKSLGRLYGIVKDMERGA
jgi:hypothetical protein